MKRNLILVAIIAVLAVGGVGALFVRQLSTTKAVARDAAAAAQAEANARAAQEARLHEAERQRGRLEKQNLELTDLATQLRQSEAKQASNIAALAKQSTNPAAATALPSRTDMGDMLQKMMKDPAMKEMLRSQQKSLMKTMYGPLFKDLNLPAQQQQQLTDILIETQMQSMESAGDLFGGDTASRTNALNALAEKQKATTEQIKTLLGEEKYAQYQDYQKSAADRIMLNQFQQQTAGTETALSDEQYKQLVQLMKEERGKIPPIIGNDPTANPESLANLMNEEKLNEQLKWQEDFNQRVFERAAASLTAEQLKELTDFQAQQLNMQKFGLKMAREMFQNKDAK